MNRVIPEPSEPESRQTAHRKYGRHSPSLLVTRVGLMLFVLASVLIGSLASVTALVRVTQTLWGESPKIPDLPLELGLAIIVLGTTAVVGGIAMWFRRQWGWWLMVGLVFALLLALTKGAAIQILGILVWLWALRPLFGFAGPLHTLEGDLDAIAKSLGIDWNATPIARIGELVVAKQDVEATRLYREHFGCTWDEAYTGIAHWHTDGVAHKLRHISQVVKSLDVRHHDDE